MFQRQVFAVLAASLAIGGIGGAASAGEKAAFDFSILGIRVATLAYDATEGDGRYEARGSARATGMMGALFEGSSNAVSSGRVEGNRLRPSYYSEATTDNDGTVRTTIRYRGGIPDVTRDPPRSKPRKYAAPAKDQAGTFDPMTTAYAILRDQPQAQLCKLDVSMYNGARRSRLQMTSAKKSGDKVTCKGKYTRIAGFSPKEMSAQSSWPVTIDYVRSGKDRFSVNAAKFTTKFGSARLRRK